MTEEKHKFKYESNDDIILIRGSFWFALFVFVICIPFTGFIDAIGYGISTLAISLVVAIYNLIICRQHIVFANERKWTVLRRRLFFPDSKYHYDAQSVQEIGCQVSYVDDSGTEQFTPCVKTICGRSHVLGMSYLSVDDAHGVVRNFAELLDLQYREVIFKP